jgi:arylsulfatase A-like enzyme
MPAWIKVAVLFPCLLIALMTLVVGCNSSNNDNDNNSNDSNTTELPPNILFIIMDDVGIDQMTVFGYGGVGPFDQLPDPPAQPDDRAPELPSIDSIAEQGILFRNTWAMPACSTSRAVFFTGRYPLRTNVLGALGQFDLANYQVSPYELTMPKLLKQQGYDSALFGKFHIGLQQNSPFGFTMPSALGWDYFYGWLDETGDPSSIDTSAGLGDALQGRYLCGFVPGLAQDPEYGADVGACYTAQGQCEEVGTEGGIPPGRACRDSGGILDPQMPCQVALPANIQSGFGNFSAHYVSPLWINNEAGDAEQVPTTDIRARTYRGIVPVDGAIDWIASRPNDTPWVATVSFSSAHTPVMQPPQALLSAEAAQPAIVSSLLCAAPDGAAQDVVDEVTVDQRELTTLMIEAIDAEVSRLLVAIGAATLNDDQSLSLDPDSNTMIVILGDNGTLGYSVKLPFDPGRAKGTAYQTGVWVPLIVAGPLVDTPDRTVASMVNIADLYELFAEIAGIDDVHEIVPRTLDSAPMLTYLTTPDASSQRAYNFTQVGNNQQAGGTINQPCTLGTSCSQIPVSKTVCHDNTGIWWGAEPDEPGVPAGGYTQCCEVNQYQYDNGQPLFDLQPLSAEALRNDFYKVVRNHFVGDPTPSDEEEPSCDPVDATEFYQIDATEKDPSIDRAEDDLINPETGLPDDADLQVIFLELEEQLDLILDSVQPCPPGPPAGYVSSIDGNQDGIVDRKDLDNLKGFAAAGGSSWYDIDESGTTNSVDFMLVSDFLGIECPNE